MEELIMRKRLGLVLVGTIVFSLRYTRQGDFVSTLFLPLFVVAVLLVVYTQEGETIWRIWRDGMISAMQILATVLGTIFILAPALERIVSAIQAMNGWLLLTILTVVCGVAAIGNALLKATAEQDIKVGSDDDGSGVLM
jgi:hypothetical protein